MPKKTFLADKNRVHAELMRLARAGQITYYSALGAAVGKHARWPLWPIVLERISDDELAKGDPEFTNGKLTPQQKQKAQSVLDAVFSHYCPGKQAPRLPQRR